jgi:hypothetical protein
MLSDNFADSGGLGLGAMVEGTSLGEEVVGGGVEEGVVGPGVVAVVVGHKEGPREGCAVGAATGVAVTEGIWVVGEVGVDCEGGVVGA